MRSIIAITQLSIDGVMQAPGGADEDRSNGFTHGGWAMSLGDEVLHRVMNEIVAGTFDMLLGRRTYDIFASYWPNQAGGPIAAAFDKAAKHVVTHRRDALEWGPAERVGGDVADAIRRLKESDGPELHVWGSANLLQTLIAADLIDEYRFWIAPVVLGEGKRLFETGVPARALSLVSTLSTSTGVLINTYRPAGPLSTP